MTLSDLAEYAVDVKRMFRINRKMVDKGNFGEVYEGWRKSDDKHVAIKKLIQTELDVEEQKSLIRELQILSNLKHPNCLDLVGFSVDKRVTIITPFMPNGSLENALKGCFEGDPGFENFTPTKRMCSIYAICSVMSYIHSLNIIHRDFKPENVFLNEDYEIVIADFGLSRIVQENVNLTTGTIGSPLYMAPEIYSGVYTNSVDVYSFGVTLFNYFVYPITDHVILDDGKGKIKGKVNFLKRVREGARFKQDDDFPDNYFQIYQHCVDKNPSARPSFKELAELFENNDDLLLDEVDRDEYHAYIEKCKKRLIDIEEAKKKPPQPEPSLPSTPVLYI